jgi:hypothetical protein
MKSISLFFPSYLMSWSYLKARSCSAPKIAATVFHHPAADTLAAD